MPIGDVPFSNASLGDVPFRDVPFGDLPPAFLMLRHAARPRRGDTPWLS
jgi:hypothetical protein